MHCTNSSISIVKVKTYCCHKGYGFRLAARDLLYAPSHRQNSTYHSLCYTSRGALAETRNSSMGPPWRIDLTTHRTERTLLPQLHLTPLMECRKEKKINDALITFYLRLYGVRHMVKDHNIPREETRYFWLATRVLSSPRQNNTYHICYINRGALAGTRI